MISGDDIHEVNDIPEVKQKLQRLFKKYKVLVQNESFENQYWQN